MTFDLARQSFKFLYGNNRMPVEDAIPHVQEIEMYGSSIPAGSVVVPRFTDIFEHRVGRSVTNCRPPLTAT